MRQQNTIFPQNELISIDLKVETACCYPRGYPRNWQLPLGASPAQGQLSPAPTFLDLGGTASKHCCQTESWPGNLLSEQNPCWVRGKVQAMLRDARAEAQIHLHSTGCSPPPVSTTDDDGVPLRSRGWDECAALALLSGNAVSVRAPGAMPSC